MTSNEKKTKTKTFTTIQNLPSFDTFEISGIKVQVSKGDQYFNFPKKNNNEIYRAFLSEFSTKVENFKRYFYESGKARKTDILYKLCELAQLDIPRPESTRKKGTSFQSIKMKVATELNELGVSDNFCMKVIMTKSKEDLKELLSKSRSPKVKKYKLE